MNVVFLPEAIQEFEAAAQYYAECQQELSLRFIECIDSAIQTILSDPLRSRIYKDEVRRYLTGVFPYAVLYRVRAHEILIVAVMHCHREPGYWRHRTAKPRA